MNSETGKSVLRLIRGQKILSRISNLNFYSFHYIGVKRNYTHASRTTNGPREDEIHSRQETSPNSMID